MATFGSATPIAKIVTGAMPVFVGSGLRVALGAMCLLPFAAQRWRDVRALSRREWALVGAIAVFGMFGFSVLLLYGMRMAQERDPLLVAFLGALPAVPLFIPFALWQWAGFDAGGVGVRPWTALAWYGAGTLALGSWLWYAGIRKVEGFVAAGFMGVMPASALVLSYALLGESFAWLHVAGFGVVFAGVLLISWEHARMHGAHHDEEAESASPA